MSLHGNSESFDFSELMEILASREKTGVLRLHHGTNDVQLYLLKGLLCDTRAVGHINPTEMNSDSRTVRVADNSASERHSAESVDRPSLRLAETCRELLEWTHFSFDFDPDLESPTPVVAEVPVAEVLAAARAQIAEWEAIKSVIPSLDARPKPVPELDQDAVILDAQHWRLIMEMDGKRTIEDIIRLAGQNQLDTCRRLRELIDRRLVTLATRPGSPTARIDNLPEDRDATKAVAVSAKANERDAENADQTESTKKPGAKTK